MSYSSDPVLDAMHHQDELDSDDKRLIAAEIELMGQFAKSSEACDANALAPWAGTVIDNEARKALGLDWSAKGIPHRQQAFHEVMFESLDFPTSGPQWAEAMQLILNVAHGTDTNATVTQARDLLKRMGEAYASRNAEVD